MTANRRVAQRVVLAAIVIGVLPEAHARAAGADASRRALPFDAGWELSGDATRIEVHQGHRALRIRTGKAIRRDVSLEDGTIDFDVAMPRRRAFVYVLFRMGSDGEQDRKSVV